MISLHQDDQAVSITMEYIMFSAIFIAFFIIVQMSADEILVERPSSIVMENEFSDIGNMIGTTLTDMYLIAPDNGRIDTSYTIPTTIAGEYYVVNADTATTDQIIEIVSSTSNKKISVTISGIASTMAINGTVSSSSPTHRISYDSRK